jgi:hypothetical protein
VLKGTKVQERSRQAAATPARIRREDSGGRLNSKKLNTTFNDEMFNFESENHKAGEMVQRQNGFDNP